MPWMPRLSLFHKLLLFILVPIGLETAFLSGALWLFHQSELEVKQEARLNAVSNLLEQLIHSLYGAGSDIVAAATLGPEISAKSFEKHTSKVKSSLAELRQATNTDSEEREVVDSLVQSCDDTLKILKQSHDAAAEGPQGLMFMKGHRLTRQIEKIIKETIDQVTKLKELEERRKDIIPVARAHTKDMLPKLLWVATFVNIALGIFLAIYLTRSLTSRLSVMLENTERVASRRELLPAVGGSDELTQLDASMHHTSELLMAAEQRQRELEDSRKQFVAMVGHDLKNPLHFIQLSLRALSEGVIDAGSEPGQQRIAQCAEEVQRLVNLTHDLIWAARSDAESFDLKPEKTLIWTVFERASRAVQSLADSRKVTVLIEVSDERAIEVDRDRFIQVFVNLLSNAIQASQPDTTVKLTASFVDNNACLDVTDQGKGIPEEAITRVFERFYRITDQTREHQYEGMGLGLAICQSIVAAHGGTISATNQPEGGCRFRVTVPVTVATEAITLEESIEA